MSKVEDFDRRRATSLVLTDGTTRILTPTEINKLHSAVLMADQSLHGQRGVALAMLNKAENGRILTYPEAQAVAQAIEEIWLNKPLSGGVQGGGVRDIKAVCHKCGGCSAGKPCPECSACKFDVDAIGGYVRNSLSRPPTYARPIPSSPADCGCNK